MEQQKGTNIVVILFTILLTSVVVGGGVYYWQSAKLIPAQQSQAPALINQEKTIETNKIVTNTLPPIETPPAPPITNQVTTESQQFETMAEYVKLCMATEKSTQAPSGLVEVGFGADNQIDVKLPGSKVSVLVYADPNWSVGSLEDVQKFFLKSGSNLENPTSQQQEAWCGPYYGKLKLLVE